jgi:hypothetical protein
VILIPSRSTSPELSNVVSIISLSIGVDLFGTCKFEMLVQYVASAKSISSNFKIARKIDYGILFSGNMLILSKSIHIFL